MLLFFLVVTVFLLLLLFFLWGLYVNNDVYCICFQSKLDKLNSIVWPEILKLIEKEIQRLTVGKISILFVLILLLLL